MKAPGVFDIWRDEVAAKVDDRHAERHLQGWLEGSDLPPLDSYTEGHIWLLEAIKSFPELNKKLAPPAALLLENYRKKNLKSRELSRFLFNLFYFCAGLRQPAVLWESLLQIWKDKTVPGIGKLSAGYRGVPLIAGFRAALAGNQMETPERTAENDDDPRVQLVDAWYAMLEDKPDPYLGGTPMDGFEGIMRLLGPPNKTVIGWALARMSDDLHNSPFRIRQFRRLLASVKSQYSEQEWDFELLAARCEWKPWAQKLVGNPAGLVSIQYAALKDVEYIRGETKPRIRIRLPLEYRKYAARIEPSIRQLGLDFCKEPPPAGTLEPLILHLLPHKKQEHWWEKEAALAAPRKGVVRSGFESAVKFLRKNVA